MYEFSEEEIMVLNNQRLKKMVEVPQNIKKLNIRRNKIPELVFSDDNSIIYLDASDNIIKSMSGVSKLKNLEVLDLGYNLLKEIQLLDLNNLKELYLMSNDIKKLENISYPNLIKLDVADNEIEIINKIDAPMLKEFYCAVNRVSDIGDLTYLTELKNLDLQYNKIKSIDCNLLPKSLEQLMLDGNENLEEIKNIDLLTNLKFLSIKKTKVEIESNRFEVWH